ncbi:hypothetical protein ACFL1H_04055 [Nanoarchaeota archaeon]
MTYRPDKRFYPYTTRHKYDKIIISNESVKAFCRNASDLINALNLEDDSSEQTTIENKINETQQNI